jgi:hypothetical protein
LAEPRRECAQDQQVFAYRLGDFIVIEPEPSAQEELLVLAGERAAKEKPSTEEDRPRAQGRRAPQRLQMERRRAQHTA